MDFLEYEALRERVSGAARGLVDELAALINARFDRTEQIMAEQSQQIRDLNDAVDRELTDDAAQNQLIAQQNQRIAELEAAVQAAQAAQAEAVAAAAAAVAGEADAEQRLADANAALEAALADIASATEKLKSNDSTASGEGSGSTDPTA